MENVSPASGFDAARGLPTHYQFSVNFSAANTLTGQSLNQNLFEQIFSLPASSQANLDERADDSKEGNVDNRLDEAASAESQDVKEASAASKFKDDKKEKEDVIDDAVAEQAVVVVALKPSELSTPRQDETPAEGDKHLDELTSTLDSSKQHDQPSENELSSVEASSSTADEQPAGGAFDAEQPDMVTASTDADTVDEQSVRLNNQEQLDASKSADEQQQAALVQDKATTEQVSPEVEDVVERTNAELDERPSIDPQVQRDEEVSSQDAPRVQRSERREKWYESDSNASHPTVQDEEPKPLNSAREDQPPQSVEHVAATSQASEVDSSQQETTTAVSASTTVATTIESISTNMLGLNGGSVADPGLAGAPVGSQTGEAVTQAANGTESTSAASRNGRSDAKPTSVHAERTADLTQAERVRLVQRVSRSFARLGPTGGSINLKLHPPQLGSLSIQVRLEGRTMTAKLTTESTAARDAILESLPVLRGRLAEQGFEISQFQVDVADSNANAANSSGNQLDQSGSEAGQSNRQVDQRRLSLQQRQRQENAGSNLPVHARDLSWQALAGIDLHA